MQTVLTIAGSDSGGGAGIQADLKTFEAFGLFGTSVLTVLTAQNTTGVTAIEPVTPEFVTAQLQAVFDDFDIAAVKIGMLYSRESIDAVRTFLDQVDRSIPIVFDPVCISKAGSPLLQEDAVDALKSLFPYATVATPNRHEAELLFGYRFGDTDSLAGVIGAPCAVLVKNQTMEGPDGVINVDQLFNGHTKRVFTTAQVNSSNLHGTGCSFSSALAACLAQDLALEPAIERAKAFISAALQSAPNIGKGPGPINHKAGGLHVS